MREKTQLALDRNMPGMFSWTLHYDATGELGLHRVMHHYMVFQRGIPDLNLDGKVDAADANRLADKMGSVLEANGTATPAAFDEFYRDGNWEDGDRDGNRYVNQQDADWLAGRFAALGVNLPDRLAYSGTFENFQNSRGLAGRWRAKREAGGNLRETGNYAQHGASGLTWSGTGVGAGMRSNNAVTIRNQNAEEAAGSLNTLPRSDDRRPGRADRFGAGSGDVYYIPGAAEHGNAVGRHRLGRATGSYRWSFSTMPA